MKKNTWLLIGIDYFTPLNIGDSKLSWWPIIDLILFFFSLSLIWFPSLVRRWEGCRISSRFQHKMGDLKIQEKPLIPREILECILHWNLLCYISSLWCHKGFRCFDIAFKFFFYFQLQHLQSTSQSPHFLFS